MPRLIFLSVASRTLSNPPINNHSTPHTSHFTPASALGGVAPPRGGETCRGPYPLSLRSWVQGGRAARLDEPTPDQVRGDERRAAPDPAPGRGTPKGGGGELSQRVVLCKKFQICLKFLLKLYIF